MAKQFDNSPSPICEGGKTEQTIKPQCVPYTKH